MFPEPPELFIFFFDQHFCDSRSGFYHVLRFTNSSNSEVEGNAFTFKVMLSTASITLGASSSDTSPPPVLAELASHFFPRLQESVNVSMKRTKYPHPQTYLFTATLNKDVRNLRRVALRKGAVICTATTVDQVLSKFQPAISVGLPAGLSHYCLPTRRVDKLACLEWLLEKKGDVQALVFCARCHETRFLAGFLVERGYRAVGLMGRMKQVERRRVLAEFVEGKANILVATDVASR